MSVAFLIIDAQYDFCDPAGALFVPGAPGDIERIASLINTSGHLIDQLYLTLDTHQVLDISHPGYWQDVEGNNPPPFTAVTSEDISTSKWIPRFHNQEVRAYLENLEKEGKFSHFIWPEHCLAGTRGAALAEPVAEAARKWSGKFSRNYITITKGTHPLTEHFGVFQAQIPIEDAPETQLNLPLIQQLETFDLIMIAGEARSHCVATSLQQLMKHAQHLSSRIMVLEDAMSDVTGLGYLADPIYKDALRKGVTFTTCRQAENILRKRI